VRPERAADWPEIAAAPDTNLHSAATAENIAHMRYTSGSTGTPKGVVIPHRAVSRLVCDTNYMQLRADDRVAHVSSVLFDAATFEIWGALAHGGQLIVIDKDVALAPQRFARVLREQRITTMLLATALFTEVARHMPAAFRTIETLMFGGEAADAEQVRAVLRSGPPRRLLHMYGPTESTTYASWYEVRELPAAARSVTIGRPVANTQLYVLDRALQPVPIGVAGELYIGGAGLAHGYWQRPELTAERFVPNPFVTTNDERARAPFVVRPSSGCMRPAIGCATRMTGRLSTWGGSTSRSNCAGFASSRARSRRC
jgi:non-ribosomal peptide synthetase component F